ncbi:hypothetical protein Q428_04390 [Fervidicella metallireducens AeB]|uniref:Stage 0 sporulation protein A homolog n=1 Tax=Fervidicella metallireducens AeB TaxID=1403537 RepID=A0A017RX08_9CLOT|nr:diguanylate cyclase [Fervidicella metallireducens]EYE89091.1 hypothetical protein Q428_04390 [Fervidicella metallireducens AeB]
MKKPEILVVEDSKFQSLILKDILNKGGYEVVCVSSAEEAINNNFYKKFDLVLLNVVLPGMNGYEFCKVVKNNDKFLPVIIITSIEDKNSLVKALNSGADDYIKKPYNVDELLARIRVQIRTRNLQLELKEKNKELEKAYDKIKEMAVTDALTGVYNRAYIKDYLDKIINKYDSASYKLSCFMIDIDNFKKVNDTFGHLVGDEVLKDVAKICKEIIRDNGAVIRFGGEEFLIILNKDIDNSKIIAEDIRSICSKSIVGDCKYTISIGVCNFNVIKLNHLNDFQKGLQEADRMLYISKNSGKNMVTINEIQH